MAATIRPATPADVAAIDRILIRSRRDAYRGRIDDAALGLGEEGARELERALDRHARGAGICLVAELAGGPAGFVDAGPTRDTDDDPTAVGQVYAIYVDPDQWRRGAGRRLMADAVTWLADAGFSQTTLWVREGNERGRAFYTALGWQPDGASKLHAVADGVEATEIRYRRPLG